MTTIEPGAAPEDLVPGDPDALERLSARLREFARNAADAVSGVERLDSAHWSGVAAEHFRDSIQRGLLQLRRADQAFQ
ncbi:MAG: putative T7SS-secreted protein, partial [bacterium]